MMKPRPVLLIRALWLTACALGEPPAAPPGKPWISVASSRGHPGEPAMVMMPLTTLYILTKREKHIEGLIEKFTLRLEQCASGAGGEVAEAATGTAVVPTAQAQEEEGKAVKVEERREDPQAPRQGRRRRCQVEGKASGAAQAALDAMEQLVNTLAHGKEDAAPAWHQHGTSMAQEMEAAPTTAVPATAQRQTAAAKRKNNAETEEPGFEEPRVVGFGGGLGGLMMHNSSG
eukprot:Skav217343  [mRNA]  locus=scaffold1410:379633:386021:- [translate_table: standard]